MTADLIERAKSDAHYLREEHWPNEAETIDLLVARLFAAEAARDEARLIGGSDANMYLRQKLAAAERVVEAAREGQAGVEWLVTMIDEEKFADAWHQVRDIVRPNWLKVRAALDGYEKAYSDKACDECGGSGFVEGAWGASGEGAPCPRGCKATDLNSEKPRG